MQDLDTFDPLAQWLEIEPHERPVDHYRLLGIERFTTDAQLIAAAADERMALVRSFQTGPRGKYTPQVLNQLAAAKLCLLKPQTKATYDAALHARLSAVNEPLAPPLSRAAPLPPPVAEDRPFPAPPAVATAKRVEAKPNEKQTQVQPVYRRRWFPVAVIAGVVLVAGLVWGIGQLVSPRATKPDETNVAGVEADDQPSVPSDDVAPAAARVVTQEGNGAFHFPVSLATLHGDNARRASADGTDVVRGFRSADDRLTWEFNVIQPGSFQVAITYSTETEAAGGEFEFAVGESKKSGETRPSNGRFITDQYFLWIERRGQQTFEFRPLDVRGDELMTLKEIRFTPSRRQ